MKLWPWYLGLAGQHDPRSFYKASPLHFLQARGKPGETFKDHDFQLLLYEVSLFSSFRFLIR